MTQTQIAPQDAPNLNLSQIWGNEDLDIPIAIDNLAGRAVTVTIQLQLEAASGPAPPPIAVSSFPVSLDAGGSITMTAQVTIPTTLSVGQLYVFDAKSSGSGLNPFEAQTEFSFEFVGTAAFGMDVKSDANHPDANYVNILADRINSVDPFNGQPPADGEHFTAFFESPGGYDNPNLAPYRTASDPNPTIGIGLNLNSPISSAVQTQLAADVRAYYNSNYSNDLSSMSDTQVIAMLKSQAERAYVTKTTAPQAITVDDAQHLFDMAYSAATTIAMNFVNGTTDSWDSLDMSAQWAIIDLCFNGGGGISDPSTGFTKLQNALQQPGGPDYLRAGFELINSLRSADQVQYLRSLADDEYLAGSAPLLE